LIISFTLIILTLLVDSPMLVLAVFLLRHHQAMGLRVLVQLRGLWIMDYVLREVHLAQELMRIAGMMVF
jgi:hypothetical protein